MNVNNRVGSTNGREGCYDFSHKVIAEVLGLLRLWSVKFFGEGSLINQHHGDLHKSLIRGSTTAAGFACEVCGWFWVTSHNSNCLALNRWVHLWPTGRGWCERLASSRAGAAVIGLISARSLQLHFLLFFFSFPLLFLSSLSLSLSLSLLFAFLLSKQDYCRVWWAHAKAPTTPASDHFLLWSTYHNFCSSAIQFKKAVGTVHNGVCEGLPRAGRCYVVRIRAN